MLYLRKQRDYPELWKAFEELNAFKVLRSAYLLDLENTSALQVRDHLTHFIDADDGMFVIEFAKRPAAFKCEPGTAKWFADQFG